MKKGIPAVALFVVFGIAFYLMSRDKQKPETPPDASAAADAAEKPDAPPPPAVLEGKGTIKGRVAFTGPQPEAEALRTQADPFCAGFAHHDESVVVNGNRTLRNVVVRLSNAPRTAAPAGLAPQRLEQTTCMYRPHVSAVFEGQVLQIVNADKTLHNVHTYLDDKTVFNRAQPPVATLPPIEWAAKSAGSGILMARCDVHPWMRAYVAITPHPWFAVTGDDGAFELKDVPAGTWQIEAWHEKYGAKQSEVKLAKDGVAEVAFSYAAN